MKAIDVGTYSDTFNFNRDLRDITGHEVNAANRVIAIAADQPSHGNASHEYVIAEQSGIGTDHNNILGIVKFQFGPVRENGTNGVTNESLLAIVVDRLRRFQSGDYACRENALALTKIEEALHWLHSRTRERTARNVEGTSNQ